MGRSLIRVDSHSTLSVFEVQTIDPTSHFLAAAVGPCDSFNTLSIGCNSNIVCFRRDFAAHVPRTFHVVHGHRPRVALPDNGDPVFCAGLEFIAWNDRCARMRSTLALVTEPFIEPHAKGVTTSSHDASPTAVAEVSCARLDHESENEIRVDLPATDLF